MYVPSKFRDDDRERQIAFMRQFSFALLVSSGEQGPNATHVPVTVRAGEEGLFVRGHLAKANPHWRLLGTGETLVVFSGPHAYVSPRHYDAWESVPTWNYLAVHAYGPARVIHDAENLELLEDLVEQHEPAYRERWQGLSDRYRSGMLGGIVGFEVRVARIEATAKLSQNKSEDEQERIAVSLAGSPDPAARATGEEMLRRSSGGGEGPEPG